MASDTTKMAMETETETETETASSPQHENKKVVSRQEFELKQEETLSPAPPLEALTINNRSKQQSLESSDKENDIHLNDESEEEESDDEATDLFIGLNKEQIAKIKQTMNEIHAEYKQHCIQQKKQQIQEIQQQIQFNLAIDVNDEEAEFIADFVEENNQNLLEKLEDEGVVFLESMKEMMEQKKLFGDNHNNFNNNNNNNNYYDDDDQYNYDNDDDEDWVLNEKKKKSQRAAKRKNVPKNTNLDGSQRCGRLLLNDALKDMATMDGWSDARKKAWNNRKTSPNAYFYRFNVPGQPQKNGKWTMDEHKNFMKRVIEFGVNDQWGIFSKKIPGRVGYQCSNYWRGLVKDGDVSDPNYHYDGKKLHFKRHTKTFSISNDYRRFAITINRDPSKIWSNLPKKHPRHPSDSYCKSVQEALAGNGDYSSNNNNNNNKRKRGNGKNDDDEDWNGGKPMTKRRKRNRRYDNDDGDETFHCKVSSPQKAEDDDNPMTDFIDIMTGTVVSKPAISPYGHVLGYDTWTKILRTSKHKNMCPFTLQKMTRRSLIKLTKENYDQYKEKITNITKEQTELMNQMNQINESNQ